MAKDKHPLRITSLPIQLPCGEEPPGASSQEQKKTAQAVFFLSHWPDSNRRPTHYECVALPTEPQWRLSTKEISVTATSDEKRVQK